MWASPTTIFVWRVCQRQLLLQPALWPGSGLEGTRMAQRRLYDVQAGPIVRDNFKHFSLFAHGLIGMAIWPDRIPGRLVQLRDIPTTIPGRGVGRQ